MKIVKNRRAKAFSNFVKIGGIGIILDPSGQRAVLISQIHVRPYIFGINLKKCMQKLLKDKSYTDTEGETNLKDPKNYSIVVDGISSNAPSNERIVTLAYAFNNNLDVGLSATIWTRPFKSTDAKTLLSYLDKDLSYRKTVSNLMIQPARHKLLSYLV